MAAARAAIVCGSTAERSPSSLSSPIPKSSPRSLGPEPQDAAAKKIMLQPRVCTLRSYGPSAASPMQKDAGVSSNFFASLAEYVENTRRSQDLEILSGRLAMIAFVAAIAVESVTGNSLFKKLELQQIEEAGGVCLVVVASAAAFAWFTSARSKINQMLTLGCNTFVDSLIDNIVDGLFYDIDLSDWSDEFER